MNLAPQTISVVLTERLNALKERCVYADEVSFLWKQLKRDCDNLAKVEPAEGWAALGMLHTVSGNLAEAERSFGLAATWGPAIFAKLNLLTSYSSLGYITKAHQLYGEIGSDKEMFQYSIPMAFYFGAFHSIIHNIESSHGMELDMSSEIIETTKRSVEILKSAGVTDDDVARHLDIAGAILREKHMFEARTPEILATNIEGVIQGVTMVLYISVPQDEVFGFNLELAMKEDEFKIIKNPAFDVVFSAMP